MGACVFMDLNKWGGAGAEAGVVRYLRDAPPAHYSLRINSFLEVFDLLKGRSYESATFSASGYTWRLVLYPNGVAKGKKHISLYLAIEKTESLPLGWEAHVTIKMFVYNSLKDKYLTIQDDLNHDQIRRFHQAKKEHGFDRLISLDVFKDASNGYLVDGSCVFGVEVFDVQHSGGGEVLKTINNPVQHTFSWKITQFSSITQERLTSDEQYVCGDHKWRLLVYPKGKSTAKGYLSLYLKLDESPSTCKGVLAQYSLVIKDQTFNKHSESSVAGKWFKVNDVDTSWGFPEFMLLSELTNKSSGFMVEDSILIEAKITIKAQVITFS